MDNSKVKKNYLNKEIIYRLLVILIIVFLVKSYQTSISNILLITLGIFCLLRNLYQIIKYILNNNYLILIIMDFFIKFTIIILSLICLFLYILEYNEYKNGIINVILFSICIICIIFYRKQIFILIITCSLVFIISYLLGSIQSTDFSIAALIFLFGLIFAIVENIEKFINLDKYYPKEITTLENDEIIKRNKVTLNLIIGILFMLSYVILKLLTIQHIQHQLLIELKLNVFNRYIGVGLLIIIAIEVLIILSLLILTKILKKISVHSKDYDNKTIAELMYSILTFGIKQEVELKVIDKIAIGNHDIDQVNPEVFIENIREIPKDTHILLSKIEDVPTIRKLLVIYPNKKVYSCKLSISKNIVKRISEVKPEDTV